MSEMGKFRALHKRLAKLIEDDEGATKSTSGDMSIHFKCPFSYRSEEEQEIWIEFNGYDILDWSRNEVWGPFFCFTEALGFLLQKVEEAEAAFKLEQETGNVEE